MTEKEWLETLLSILEPAAGWFTVAGAFAALLFVFVSRPLRKIEAHERQQLAFKMLQAETNLEQERKTRLQMEASLAPRHIALTPAVLERLKQFHGTNASLTYITGDSEAGLLATFLSVTLRGAEWNLPHNLYHSAGLIGLGVQIKHSPELADAANMLHDFLTANAIESAVISDRTITNGLSVFVFANPQAYFRDIKVADVVGMIDPSKKRVVLALSEENAKRREEETKRQRDIWYPATTTAK